MLTVVSKNEYWFLKYIAEKVKICIMAEALEATVKGPKDNIHCLMSELLK